MQAWNSLCLGQLAIRATGVFGLRTNRAPMKSIRPCFPAALLADSMWLHSRRERGFRVRGGRACIRLHCGAHLGLHISPLPLPPLLHMALGCTRCFKSQRGLCEQRAFPMRCGSQLMTETMSEWRCEHAAEDCGVVT